MADGELRNSINVFYGFGVPLVNVVLTGWVVKEKKKLRQLLIVKWKLLTKRCYLQMDQNSMSPFMRMSSYFRTRCGWMYVKGVVTIAVILQCYLYTV